MNSYIENELKQKKIPKNISKPRNQTADLYTVLATDRSNSRPSGHSVAALQSTPVNVSYRPTYRPAVHYRASIKARL